MICNGKMRQLTTYYYCKTTAVHAIAIMLCILSIAVAVGMIIITCMIVSSKIMCNHYYVTFAIAVCLTLCNYNCCMGDDHCHICGCYGCMGVMYYIHIIPEV